ncbi:MAG TPA: DUF63 family protein [Candidatus Thermoplasmatota archaeon]|nr:DUF63 family protein [Candidatus Thermoplasmatota archaeon]
MSDERDPPSPGPASPASPAPEPGARQDLAAAPADAPSAMPPASPPLAAASTSAARQPPLLERLPAWTVPAILLGVPLLFTLLAKLVPAFYDQVVWQYYWGPIKADAEGQVSLVHHGVVAKSGYNLVNTASWAILLGVGLLGIAQLLQWTGTPMDAKLIVGATGWVVAGSVFHVMEDTGLFLAPLQYFFITPPIYLMFTVGGVASLVIGHYLRRVERAASLDVALQKLWFILCIPVLVYLALWLKRWDQVTHYVNPVWVALFALAAYVVAVWRFRRIGRLEPAELVGILSIGWILFSIAYTISFVKTPWFPQHGAVPEALWAPVLAALVVAAMFGLALVMVGRAERRGKPKSRDFWFAFFTPINLLLLFSQMLDGFATAIGIDAGGYSEKHVLSAALIDIARATGDKYHIGFLSQHPTFFGFTTVKFAISLLVISAIDGSARTEEERRSPLVGLVKFAIIMVGIGPGIRDFVRMSLGV